MIYLEAVDLPGHVQSQIGELLVPIDRKLLKFFSVEVVNLALLTLVFIYQIRENSLLGPYPDILDVHHLFMSLFKILIMCMYLPSVIEVMDQVSDIISWNTEILSLWLLCLHIHLLIILLILILITLHLVLLFILVYILSVLGNLLVIVHALLLVICHLHLTFSVLLMGTILHDL